jgi:2,3,4,5-tetrahydropyridine-2-carboxylate N-succinyltransferase
MTLAGTIADIRRDVESLFDVQPSRLNPAEAGRVFGAFRALLDRGEIRAAEKSGDGWAVNAWVKKGILLGFRAGVLEETERSGAFRFFDKDTLPLKQLSVSSSVRVVPGGSAIREGAFVAAGVICMPPSYINIGAYVDEGTMVDSHALVGSCAQIGKRVHLSAGAQVGGVLEPVGALPVILEDDVFVGGNCGVYEGTIVRSGAVLAAGVILTGGTAVYDVVRENMYRKEGSRPLEIPAGAVVVPGSRGLKGDWASEHRLAVATPVIVKYRDARTGVSTLLEESLR